MPVAPVGPQEAGSPTRVTFRPLLFRFNMNTGRASCFLRVPHAPWAQVLFSRLLYLEIILSLLATLRAEKVNRKINSLLLNCRA